MKQIEQQLREEILKQLGRVNKKNCPKIHRLIQTREGYASVEERIINMVASEGITPSACIPQIEVEL